MAQKQKEPQIRKGLARIRHYLQKLKAEAKALTELRQKRLDNNLIRAAQNGDAKEAERLLDKGANIEAMDPFEKNFRGWKRTPLLLAIGNDQRRTYEMLIKRGANVNARDLMHITPLMIAAQGGDAHACRLLIEKGANLFAKELEGMTALDFAENFSTPDHISAADFRELLIQEYIKAAIGSAEPFLSLFRECFRRCSQPGQCFNNPAEHKITRCA